MHILDFRILPGYLDPVFQARLIDIVQDRAMAAPLFHPAMPRTGKPFSVRMTNLGELGWVSDVRGYRYQQHHPGTGRPWPSIPEELLKLWSAVAGYPHSPQACLVNYYDGSARMGLHQDRDEQDFDAPVVSVSLGDTAVFRMGGSDRNSPTRSIRLQSGDVVVMAGKARLAFHGVDRVIPGTSCLLKDGGRLNLTLRRVTKPRCE